MLLSVELLTYIDVKLVHPLSEFVGVVPTDVSYGMFMDYSLWQLVNVYVVVYYTFGKSACLVLDE